MLRLAVALGLVLVTSSTFAASPVLSASPDAAKVAANVAIPQTNDSAGQQTYYYYRPGWPGSRHCREAVTPHGHRIYRCF